MRRARTNRGSGLGAIAIAFSAAIVAYACSTTPGGSTCFSAVLGPDSPSCDGFDLGLMCPIGITPYYDCVCSKVGPVQKWVCAPAGMPIGTGGAGGTGGSASGAGGQGGAQGGGGGASSSAGGQGGSSSSGGGHGGMGGSSSSTTSSTSSSTSSSASSSSGMGGMGGMMKDAGKG